MTNPDNALGTNGAFGGRTSVNAFNDVLATFDGAGIVSGFAVAPDTGMTVEVGGSGTTRDVAVAEDPFGNRTTVDNISGDPIPVTIDTASTTTARIDSIVAYVNSPANASDTATDNPTACGIISVNGTSGGAPLDTAIRTAITADGGTGSTAYYVVIANVSVPANTTTITSGLISAGKSINLTDVVTSGSNGLMLAADKAKIDSNIYTQTTTPSVALPATGTVYALERNGLCLASVQVRSNSSTPVPAYTDLATGLPKPNTNMDLFFAAVNAGGQTVRMFVTSNGVLRNANALTYDSNYVGSITYPVKV